MRSAIKKCSALALALLFVVYLVPAPIASAVDESDNGIVEETYVEDLGNGIVVTSTLTVYPSTAITLK